MNLTRQQLCTIKDEITALTDWTVVRDFANQMYGEGKVAKVEIETDGQYDDEGGTNYHVSWVHSYDAQGKEVEYDRSLPFFQSPSWKYLVQLYKDDEYAYYDEDEDHDVMLLLKDMNIQEGDGPWLLPEDLPCDRYDFSYDLTKQPSLSFTIEPLS